MYRASNIQLLARDLPKMHPKRVSQQHRRKDSNSISESGEVIARAALPKHRPSRHETTNRNPVWQRRKERPRHEIPERLLKLVAKEARNVRDVPKLRLMMFRCLRASPGLLALDDEWIWDTVGLWTSAVRKEPFIVDKAVRHYAHAYFKRCASAIPHRTSAMNSRYARLLSSCITDWERALTETLTAHPEWLLTDAQLQRDSPTIPSTHLVGDLFEQLPFLRHRNLERRLRRAEAGETIFDSPRSQAVEAVIETPPAPSEPQFQAPKPSWWKLFVAAIRNSFHTT
jgi:hypothetical protein